MAASVIDLKIPAALDRRNRRSLADIADSLNETVREVREFQNDRRLKMALDLAEAKALCADQGIPFKRWVEDNVELVSYPEAARLAKVGEADNPAQALEHNRQIAREGMQKARQARVINVNHPEPTPPPSRGKEAICERAAQAVSLLAGMPPAAEVAGYFRDSDQAILLDERLLPALDWLNAFSESWSNPDA